MSNRVHGLCTVVANMLRKLLGGEHTGKRSEELRACMKSYNAVFFLDIARPG